MAGAHSLLSNYQLLVAPPMMFVPGGVLFKGTKQATASSELPEEVVRERVRVLT